MTDDRISLSETIELLIKSGMTRRQAKRWLLKHLASGEIRSTADTVVINGQRIGGPHEVPPEFWDNAEVSDD